MGKSKFGGDKYKPHQLGAEPAEPTSTAQPTQTELVVQPPLPPTASVPPVAPKTPTPPETTMPVNADPKLRDIKVQFSSRISYAADQQLKALAAKQGVPQTELLGQALNLLFKKHGLDEHA